MEKLAVEGLTKHRNSIIVLWQENWKFFLWFTQKKAII